MAAIAWVTGIGIFLWLLFAYPKKMLILIVGVVALGAATVGVFWLQDVLAKRLMAQMAIRVVYDPADCSPTHPLSVAIHNRSNATILHIYYRVEGLREGYSSPHYVEWKWTDKILQSDDTFRTCLAFRQKSVDDTGLIRGMEPSSLIWRAEITNATTDD